jgi:hypothetical protein
MSDILIAKQFTAIYDEREDRLRLIININYPNRYDFWITRKFLIDIMDNLQNYIMKFKDDYKNSQNETSNNSKDLPIYEPTNNPTLLDQLNITKKDNFFILTLQNQEKTVQATLTFEDLNNLLKTIIQPVRIRWGLGF